MTAVIRKWLSAQYCRVHPYILIVCIMKEAVVVLIHALKENRCCHTDEYCSDCGGLYVGNVQTVFSDARKFTSAHFLVLYVLSTRHLGLWMETFRGFSTEFGRIFIHFWFP